jgi:hypothetical protein
MVEMVKILTWEKQRPEVMAPVQSAFQAEKFMLIENGKTAVHRSKL